MVGSDDGRELMTKTGNLELEVIYPERLSRWLIFLKWLLILPHLFVLSALYFALSFSTILAWFAILLTGRYPRGLWIFAAMTLRWQANVNAYLSFQRDEYPPFGEGEYPVWFDLPYPDRLSRLLIFVKWLLILPHLVVYWVLGIALSISTFLAWFAILITGRYPRSLFQLTTDISRWGYRIAAYTLLLSDAYPPFSLSGSGAPPPEIASRLPYGLPTAER